MNTVSHPQTHDSYDIDTRTRRGIEINQQPKMSPKPAIQPVPLPTIAPEREVHLISNLLIQQECTSIIDDHANLIPSNVTPTTIRDREVFSDLGLASLLWSRIHPFFPNERVIDEDGETWKVTGLNEVFRLCRYVQGMLFKLTSKERMEALMRREQEANSHRIRMVDVLSR